MSTVLKTNSTIEFVLANYTPREVLPVNIGLPVIGFATASITTQALVPVPRRSSEEKTFD
jgi:hypothetical protein